MPADPIALLTQRQAQLTASCKSFRTRETILEHELGEAREARAACEGAKHEVDEMLAMLVAARSGQDGGELPTTTPPKP